jgi:POT family proton-dependent oligopeptide transporter
MDGTTLVQLSGILRNFDHSRIVLAATFQRIGYYGLRSLLLIYLITEFKMSDLRAGQTYGVFYGSFFLTSLGGGLLGDKLGHKLAGSLGLSFMLVAQLSMAIGHTAGTIVGLVMYSIGFGLFNPNMNAAIAQQYQTDENLRAAAYTILYSGINLGAMIGPLVCGYIVIRTNWRYGFLSVVPFTILGLVLFAPSIRSRDLQNSDQSRVSRLQERTSNEEGSVTLSQRTRFIIIGSLGILVLLFAGVFDQLGSSVTLLVHKHAHRAFSTFTIPAGYVQSLNPFIVILCGPLLSLILKRGALSSTQISKLKLLVAGFFLLGTGFLLLSIGSTGLSDYRGQFSVGWTWILSAIVLASLGELLFAPTSVSLFAGLSPARHRGLAMGVWAAAWGLGVYLSGTVSGLVSSSGKFSRFFAISAVGCLSGCLFIMVAIRRLKNTTYQEATVRSNS